MIGFQEALQRGDEVGNVRSPHMRVRSALLRFIQTTKEIILKTNCSSPQERKKSGSSIATAATTSAAVTAEATASSVLAGTASSNSGFLKPSEDVPGEDLPSVFAKNVSRV